MIVRFEQVNARGEASAAGRSGRPGRAAGPRRPGRGDAGMRLRAAGEIPGPQASALERDLIAALREVRSVRAQSRRRVPCDRIRR